MDSHAYADALAEEARKEFRSAEKRLDKRMRKQKEEENLTYLERLFRDIIIEMQNTVVSYDYPGDRVGVYVPLNKHLAEHAWTRATEIQKFIDKKIKDLK